MVYNSHCAPDSYCLNTKGSYLCICNDGYMGNGMDVNGGCSDIDEWFVSQFFSENIKNRNILKHLTVWIKIMHASSTAIVQIMLALIIAVVKLDTKVIPPSVVLILMSVEERLLVTCRVICDGKLPYNTSS